MLLYFSVWHQVTMFKSGYTVTFEVQRTQEMQHSLGCSVMSHIISWFFCCCCYLRLCVCAGALTGHTVRCPWHGACFNVHTGDLEEYPGIDSLPCHKVNTDTQTDGRFTFKRSFAVILILSVFLLKVKIQNSKVYVSVNKKVSWSTFQLRYFR